MQSLIGIRALAMPYCTMVPGDLGVDTIKMKLKNINKRTADRRPLSYRLKFCLQFADLPGLVP